VDAGDRQHAAAVERGQGHGYEVTGRRKDDGSVEGGGRPVVPTLGRDRTQVEGEPLRGG